MTDVTGGPVARFLKPSRDVEAIVLIGQAVGSSAVTAARRLASDGVGAIAVEYFARRGTESELAEVEVLAVARAVCEEVALRGLKEHPLVLVSHSRGCELAFFLAQQLDGVAGIAASSASAIVNSAMRSVHMSFDQPAWLVGGVPPEHFRGKYRLEDYVRLGLTGRLDQHRRFRGWSGASPAWLPAPPAHCRILLQYGDNDRFWPSVEFARGLTETVCLANNVDEVRYRDCGHMGLFPGSLPGSTSPVVVRESLGMGVDFGGSSNINSAAARDSYRAVLRFLASISKRRRDRLT